MYKALNHKFLFVFAAASLLASCGGEQKNDEQKVDINQVEATVEVDTSTSVNLLPSPLHVAMIFDDSGLEFDGSSTNDLGSVKKYTTQWEKSINFGVYSADLAYAVLNEKTSESKAIINVVREMSKEIGLSTVFEGEDILGRFEKNVGNKDSVLEILVTIEERTDDYIEENGEHALGNVMFAGAWIEGMYIGAQAALKEGKTELGMKLSEQMIICENLIKALSLDEPNEDKDKLIADLKDIDATYKGLESVKNLEGDEAYNAKLTDAEVKTLAEKLSALRNKIVKA